MLVYNTGNTRYYQIDQDQFFKNRSRVGDITVDWLLINNLIITRIKLWTDCV